MNAAQHPEVCATAGEAAREIRRAIGPTLDDQFADNSGWTEAPSGGSGDAIFWREVPGAPMVELKSEATIEADPLAVAALIRESDLTTLAGELRVWAPVALTPFHHWVYYVSALPTPLADRAFEVRQLFGVAHDDTTAAGPSIWILGEDLGGVERARATQQTRARFEALTRQDGAKRGSVHVSAYRLRPRPARDGWHTELRRWIHVDVGIPRLPVALSTRLLVGQLRGDHRALRRCAEAFENSAVAARVATAGGAGWYAAVRDALRV